MRIRFERTTCSHIRIKDMSGAFVFTTSFEEIQRPVISTDHPVLIGLKQLLLNADTSLGVNVTKFVDMAELREF